MISKISKLLTATLLLAVSFNNSYAINNMNLAQDNYSYENNMDNVLLNVNQFNNAYNNRQVILNYMTQWINSSPQMQLNSQLGNTLNMLQFHNQQMVNTTLNFNTQMKMLYDNVFANNYGNILSLFAAWDLNMLNKLNNIFSLQQVKQYISQWRIEKKLSNEINEIGQRLVNRIQQHGINDPNQLDNECYEVINSIFRKYYERIEIFYNTIDNHFLNDNEQQRRNIVDIMRNNLKESFNQRYNYINVLFNNVVNNRNNIINSIQVQHALNQNNNINIDINVHHDNVDNVFHQILTNINQNHEVNANIKQFFDNYIGDKYDKVFNIFNINDNQELNDIKEILKNNTVKDYLAIGAIRDRLDINLDKRRFFKGGIDDQGNDNDPADYETFKNHYLNYMEHFINNYKDNIKNIIRIYIDNINSNHNQIKQDIKTVLNQCIDDREQYLNNRLQQIRDNIDNTYQEYLNSYGIGNNQ